MKIFKLILFLSITIPFIGCKKYLEKEPRKQTTIQTVDQLQALIDNATAFTYDGNNATAAYSTDDTEIPMDSYKKFSTKWSIENLYSYVFNVDQIVGFATDPLWSGEYKKIFTANLILYNIDKVTGDNTEREQVRADAYFIRAYSYWVLANHYCLPYSSTNLNELGLPLKKTVSYDEPLTRSTLKETYDFIESDLVEAAKVAVDDVDPQKRWRVSKKAIQAFLSRYYLFIGDYDKSLENSNLALASTGATLVDFKTIQAGTPASYTNPSVTLNYSELNNWSASQYLYWGEFYYARYSYTSGQWWLPSTALQSLYDKSNDLRYKWLMIENGGRRFSVLDPLVRYSYFFDGRYIPTGPTVAEMLLNKAEVLARKGQIADAMTAVNTLRLKRLINNDPLTASDKDDAINKVLEERRREMPFAMRWFDIRRFSVNDYPGDDVTVNHTFFKVGIGVVDTTTTVNYTLSPGSKRYAVPINGVEMDASQGQIIQNNY
ncbi:MAG TPA: RagB/SusD family nutrient uptake outer membrane protein [Chitinophagaceae bacterium]|jgi:hypothetical protein|nr:RagB/SusD family nutrient uptake outer membrane protein [Chitinophagaceae bacterium]